jgi:hypothetical protein
MLHTPLAKISSLLAAVVIAWALARGRWPERVAGAAIAIDWICSAVFQDRRLHHHGQPVMFALDILQAVVLLALAIGCRRIWVLWAAALASLLILTHLVYMVNPAFGQWSYLTVTYVWSFGLLAAVAAGVAFEGGRSPDAAPWTKRSAQIMAARLSIPSAKARRRN